MLGATSADTDGTLSGSITFTGYLSTGAGPNYSTVIVTGPRGPVITPGGTTAPNGTPLEENHGQYPEIEESENPPVAPWTDPGWDDDSPRDEDVPHGGHDDTPSED